MKTFAFILLFSLLSSLMAAEKNLLPLMGQGQYKWFLINVYEAKLWAEKGDDLYSKSLLLELKYSRSFKGSDIVDQSIKELSNSGSSKAELEIFKKTLLEIFPNVSEGDSIQASYNPTSGVTFQLNSVKELGRLSDLTLSKKFLDIWLGEKTSAPDLREKLLGKKI